MNLLNVLLMAPQGEGGGSGIQSLIMLGLIVVVFYFFMIRPQMKRSKAEREFRNSLQKGDQVLLLGSIHAKIVEVQESTLVVEIANNTQITVEKAAVVALPSANNRK